MATFIGWAQFDAKATPYRVAVGWAEFDVKSPTANPVPSWQPGGGVARYHSHVSHHYEIPVAPIEGDEEEEIILALLMEVAAHVVI